MANKNNIKLIQKQRKMQQTNTETKNVPIEIREIICINIFNSKLCWIVCYVFFQRIRETKTLFLKQEKSKDL